MSLVPALDPVLDFQSPPLSLSLSLVSLFSCSFDCDVPMDPLRRRNHPKGSW